MWHPKLGTIKKKLEPTPKSYKYVLTHFKFYEYENNIWYFAAFFVVYFILLQLFESLLFHNQRFNLLSQFSITAVCMTVAVFSLDYIFYRIARRAKK